MTLVRRQTFTYETFDDQSPTIWNLFVGNWTRYNVQGFQNNTLTATPTPGASISFSFSGSQAWLFGGPPNITSADGGSTSYATADYKIDGSPVSSQAPELNDVGELIYFSTSMAEGTHEIDITVTAANETNQFAFDYFYFYTYSIGGGSSSPPTMTSSSLPTVASSSLPIVTEKSTPVGAIVGGVVGGVVILVIALWYLWKKRSHVRGEPHSGGTLLDEDHTENINPPAPPPLSPGPGGPGVQSANSRPTIIGSLITRSISERTTLVAQNRQNTQEIITEDDAGAGLDEGGEQEAGSPQVQNEVPPPYTSH